MRFVHMRAIGMAVISMKPLCMPNTMLSSIYIDDDDDDDDNDEPLNTTAN